MEPNQQNKQASKTEPETLKIKNQLTVTRENGRGGYWGKEWEVLSRNMYKEHMDKVKMGAGSRVGARSFFPPT